MRLCGLNSETAPLRAILAGDFQTCSVVSTSESFAGLGDAYAVRTVDGFANDRVLDTIIVRTAEVSVVALKFIVGSVIAVKALPCQTILCFVTAHDAMA